MAADNDQGRKIMLVTLAFAGVPKIRDLEPVFSLAANDWIRYAANCWLLCTEKSPTEIYYYLHNFLDDGDDVLITPVNPREFIGRLPAWAWEWLTKNGFPADWGDHIRDRFAALMLPKPGDMK